MSSTTLDGWEPDTQRTSAVQHTHGSIDRPGAPYLDVYNVLLFVCCGVDPVSCVSTVCAIYTVCSFPPCSQRCAIPTLQRYRQNRQFLEVVFLWSSQLHNLEVEAGASPQGVLPEQLLGCQQFEQSLCGCGPHSSTSNRG